MNKTKILKRLFAVLYLLVLPACVFAQQLFAEGLIVYKVTLEKPANSDNDGKEYSGTYTLTIKGKQVRKDLKLDNGFNITILYDGDKHITYTMRNTGDKKYAVQLDNEQLKKEYGRFENFTLTPTGQKEKIAGNEGIKGVIVYPDKTSIDIIYSEKWRPDVFVYERFPGIKVLPLAFTVETGKGIILHFRVKKIESTLVENSNFKIPEEYKIISHAEYEELNK